MSPFPLAATQADVLDRPISLQQSELKAKDIDENGYLEPEITYNQYEPMDEQVVDKDNYYQPVMFLRLLRLNVYVCHIQDKIDNVGINGISR